VVQTVDSENQIFLIIYPPIKNVTPVKNPIDKVLESKFILFNKFVNNVIMNFNISIIYTQLDCNLG
jgi:hypothetical protein